MGADEFTPLLGAERGACHQPPGQATGPRGIVPTGEDASGTCRRIRHPDLLTDHLHGTEATPQHEDDGWQHRGEFGGDAALIPAATPR
jgi:hypothetical protein